MNKRKNTNKYLETIMQMPAAIEFKAMVEQLHNAQRHSKEKRINIPHYLFVATRRSVGVEDAVNIFAQYLHSSNAIEFTGVVKHLLFKLEYQSPSENFTELARFHRAMVDCAGFNRYFKGITLIDVTAWLNHRTNEPHFQLFLDYIVSESDKILAIFYAQGDTQQVERLESSLSSSLRFETVIFDIPGADDLVEIMASQHFKPRGFKLTNDAKKLLKESIDKVKESPNFSGFRLISQLAEDILFKQYTNVKTGSISACKLADFSKDSPYINRIAQPKRTEFGFNTQTRKENSK